MLHTLKSSLIPGAKKVIKNRTVKNNNHISIAPAAGNGWAEESEGVRIEVDEGAVRLE